MVKKLGYPLLFLLVGILLWVLFLCDAGMARFGIYTMVSYPIHEVISTFPYFCILVTIIWLSLLVAKSIKAKTFKENAIVISLLTVAFFLQGGYMSAQANLSGTVTSAFVESIDPVKEEIVITNDNGKVTLECPMIIFSLLEIDKEYSIMYEWKKNNPTVGKVNLIQLIENENAD